MYLSSRYSTTTRCVSARLSTQKSRKLNCFHSESRFSFHGERQAWRAIRKELEDIGTCVAAFDANKGFILNWFKTIISTEAFDEQPVEDESGSGVLKDNLSQFLEDPGHDIVLSQP